MSEDAQEREITEALPGPEILEIVRDSEIVGDSLEGLRTPVLKEQESEGPDTETLEFLCKETRPVLNHQITTLRNLDDSVLWTFRMGWVVFGLVLSALSLVIEGGVNQPSQFINLFTTIGVAASIGGFLLLFISYNHTEFKPGPSSQDIDVLLDGDLESHRYREIVLRGHRDWIKHNKRSIERYSTSLFLGQVALIVGATFVVVGILLR